jgi:hypothetical protein
MDITQEKKDFICHVAGGLGTFMDSSMLSDEIFTRQDDDTETFIKDNLLDGSSFSVHKFCTTMNTIDDQTLRELLRYFDNRNMDLSNAYIESCLVPNDLPQELRIFAECIDYREIATFEDFLEL